MVDEDSSDVEGDLEDDRDEYDNRPRDEVDIDHMGYEELLALQERVGFVTQSVPSNVLNRLPSRILKAQDIHTLADSRCTICLSGYESGDAVTTLGCMHVFHSECIGTWLKTSNKCCICKQNVN